MKLICLLLTVSLSLGIFSHAETDKSTTVLCIGDSITEGGETFKNYRQYLVPSLAKKNLGIKFIGPKKDDVSAHAGYGGRNTQFLVTKISEIYTKHPADIVLIHAGHNRFNKNQPIDSIVKETKEIIQIITKINPDANILLGQTITSGKLPKYAYIPKLNAELGKLGELLKRQGLPIQVVDHARGFDYKKHTINDKVHPNSEGAKHMAERWSGALIPLLKDKEEK